MSAFLCSCTHISVIADAIIRYLPSGSVIEYILEHSKGRTSKTLPTVVGGCLFGANVQSLITRYGENAVEEDDRDAYVYCAPRKVYSLPELVQAIRCYMYQSSEVRDWGTTPTCKILEELQAKLRKKANVSDGEWKRLCNEVDTWGIEDEDVIEKTESEEFGTH